MSPTRLEILHRNLLACRRCPNVTPPVVTGRPVRSRIYLLGQAPGVHEGKLGRPFAWTAGKTLFAWFARIGVSEAEFREMAYMAAVLRCFPGKARGGGDRVPSREEISRCASWIGAEIGVLRPELVIPVGRLAIEHVLGRSPKKLDDLIGSVVRTAYFGRAVDCLPLPHPSGLSSWHKTEPGKTLLDQALRALAKHPAWRGTFGVDRGKR